MQAVSRSISCFCNSRHRSNDGGGKRFVPDGVRLNPKLIEERSFHKGGLVLRYAARRWRGWSA